MIDKVQKIRKEVERLKSQLLRGSCLEANCKEEAYNEVLAILNTLQEEPISEFLNTESMIESYKQRLISQANGVKSSPLIDMCLASYKHGVNETLDTLKLSNVETVKGLQKEPVSEKQVKESAETQHVNETCKEKVNSLTQVYASEDLDDAAIEICSKVLKGETINIDGYEYVVLSDAEECFKAGAKWQKEQMMAKAIDAHCFGFQGDALFSFTLPADNYLVGSEVKVIVIEK